MTPAQMPVGASNALVTYILQLSGDPVVVQDANSKDAGNGPLSSSQKQQATNQLKSQQAPVISAAQQLGAKFKSSFQAVFNGVSVTIPARNAWMLSTINGVTGVFRAHTFTPSNIHGVPLIGAPQAWDGTNGFHGEGIKIGDIDTGVDYTHADFGGTGNPDDYQTALASDTLAPTAASFGPTAPKVKGGIDLVGDNYDASSTDPAQQTPQPDPNPLDCNSHGTHTAGTAAGFGVTSTGATYTGPYNATTISGNQWNVGPGVAPRASLYAIRVFGCSGSVSDDVLLQAMDWAVNNGMDVINMSLGADFGSADDPDSQAASNTAKDGVIVVSASGNAGNGPYITSSPGAGTRGISVAANDPTQSNPAADLALSTGTTLRAIDANGAQFTDGTTMPVKVLHDPSQPNGISLGCDPNEYTAAGVTGDLVVVQRGSCARVARAIFGEEAGAAAVLMVNNANSYPPFEGAITQDPDNGQQFQVHIPFLGVPSSFAPQLLAADGGSTTLTNAVLINPDFKALASFSSFGPSADGSLKPEVTAPGVSIASAGMGTGTGALIDSGTSMATPHTSGEAALVKQAHPSWKKVEYWKAAIMNTADPTGVADYSARGAGAGLIQAFQATHTQVVATGDTTGTASLNYGVPQLKQDFAGKEDIHLHNFGSSAATFSVGDTLDEGDAHSITLSSNSVTVRPGGDATVHVTLNVPASAAADPATAFNDWFGVGQFDDAAGLISFTPASGSNSGIGLNVPYYAVPTADSNVRTNVSANQLQKGAAVATVKNDRGAATGFADWLAWGAKDSKAGKKAGLGSADLLSAGVQTIPDAGFGIFGLQVNRPWTNPAEDEFDVLVDVNNDGTPDYDVVAVDFGALTAGVANGEDVVAVINELTGAASIHYLAGAYFNGTTMELPFDFSQLCASGSPCIAAGTPINYQVFSFDRGGGSDTFDSVASFDLFHPVFSNNFEDVVAPGATASDPTTIDTTQWRATPQLGLLVLEQNNQGQRSDETETVPVKIGH